VIEDCLRIEEECVEEEVFEELLVAVVVTLWILEKILR